jgi:hypothetical protein
MDVFDEYRKVLVHTIALRCGQGCQRLVDLLASQVTDPQAIMGFGNRCDRRAAVHEARER